MGLELNSVGEVLVGIIHTTNIENAAWILACTAAIMSLSRSRNGPQTRMVVEFLVELPKLKLTSRAGKGRL